MPSWGEISKEIGSKTAAELAGISAFDYVRRNYLARMSVLTGRATILYATRWTLANHPQPIAPEMLTISMGDLNGFMEAVHGLSGPNLDLILHSPGGSAEAAEAIIAYLRAKFDHIRVFVPHMAMSAATMMACAADEIYMGKHSFLGPIDPQMQLQTALGWRSVPAQAIIDQFEQAVIECQDPTKIRVWLPMLQQFGPDLLVSCKNAATLSESLVLNWLTKYMFKASDDRQEKASRIAKWLANQKYFKTHGRPISRSDAVEEGLNVKALEDQPDLQDVVLSIYHATTHTFSGTTAVKLIENHNGKAFLEMAAPPQVQFPAPFLFPPQRSFP